MKYMVRTVSRDPNGKVTDIADTWRSTLLPLRMRKPRLTGNTGESRGTWRTRSRLRTHPGMRLPGAPSERAASRLHGPEQWLMPEACSNFVCSAPGLKEELSPFLIQDPERIGRLGQVQRCEERLGPDFHLIQVKVMFVTRSRVA